MPITIINQLKNPYSYPVLLDGQKMALIKQNETISLPLNQKTGQLTFKYAKTTSVTVKNGDVILLEDKFPFPILTHWGFQLIYFVILFFANSLFSTDIKFLIIPLLLLVPALPYLLLPHFTIHQR